MVKEGIRHSHDLGAALDWFVRDSSSATFLLLVSLSGKSGIVLQQSGMRNAAMHFAICGFWEVFVLPMPDGDKSGIATS